MNLVQINERLKDMPFHALQQYANGSNPMVPPYLALGEIQRREKLKQQMANEQGAAQGQQPSVKEQIEQKAGLLNLQQAQIQQQQQQMMQPRPGPVPEGTPRPQEQPQEMEMAYGGLAAMPVRNDMYRFAGGGIIAFDGGGSAPRVITIPAGTSDEEIDRIRRENPDAILRPEAPMAPQAQQPQMPAPRPAQPGMPQRSPLMAEAISSAQQQPERPTPEGIMALQKAMTPPELQEEARQQRAAEAKQRMAQAEEQFRASRPSGLDNLIKVLGQAGQYKGLSGLGPAYTQNRERLAGEEAAFRREQEAMRSGAEKQQLEEAAGIFGARTKQFAGEMEGYRKQLAARTEALASLAGTDQRAIDAALGRMNDRELAELRIAADKANANKPGEAERIIARVLKLESEGKSDEAKRYMEMVSQIKGVGAAGVGGQRNQIMMRRQEMAELEKIMKDEGMMHSEEDKKWASKRYSELARMNAKDEAGEGLSMTMEDVRATAKSSGKSEADVIAAAKARGYTIK